MKVAILTAAYNAAMFLERYWSGIKAQSYSPLEIVFVDDGSIDGTINTFRKLAESRTINGLEVIALRQDENKGPPAAMNLGMEFVKGDFIIPLDADDTLLPGAVNLFSQAFRQNWDVELVCADYRLCDERYQPLPAPRRRRELGQVNNLLHAILAHGMLTPAGSYCYRRDVIQLLPQKKFTEEYQAQNLELLLHSAASCRWHYIPVPTVEILVRHDSRSRANTLERLRRKVLGSHRLQREVARMYRVPWCVRRQLERRLMPLEGDYYFLSNDCGGVLRTFFKSILLGCSNRRLVALTVATIFPMFRATAKERYFNGFVLQ